MCLTYANTTRSHTVLRIVEEEEDWTAGVVGIAALEEIGSHWREVK